MARKFVAYFRTNDEDDLKEQVACVKDHLRKEEGRLLKSYRDDEGGKGTERPELNKALRYAKRNETALIVATLKGLSRDIDFLRELAESEVEFFACDLPQANSATVQVLIAVALYESQLASVRSRRALAAYKANGGKLGAARPEGRNLDHQARVRGARKAGLVLKTRADDAYRSLAPMMRKLRDAGWTLREIAERLNQEGRRTRLGRPWSATQVARVLERQLS